MRTTLLVLHIIGVALWLGANGVMAFIGPRVTRAATDTRVWWAESQAAMARVLYNVAGVLILLTGILLVVRDGDDGFEFSTAFVSVGFAAIIIGAVLGIVVFAPGARRVAAAAREGDETTERSTSGRLAAFGMLDSLVVVVTIVAMVGKWGL